MSEHQIIGEKRGKSLLFGMSTSSVVEDFLLSVEADFSPDWLLMGLTKSLSVFSVGIFLFQILLA